jgi:hypothetical protein
MSRVWGREETYRWPSDKPVWTITALALTVVAVLAAATHEYLREWTYFQQAYLGTYIGRGVRLWSKTTPSLVAYRIEGGLAHLYVLCKGGSGEVGAHSFSL